MLLLFGGGFIVLPATGSSLSSYRTYSANRVMIGDEKDPLDLRDYTIDWRGMLGLDTVDVSLWLVPPGLTGVSAEAGSDYTSIFVSGGTAGQDYTVVNRVITDDGRQFERSLLVPVREL